MQLGALAHGGPIRHSVSVYLARTRAAEFGDHLAELSNERKQEIADSAQHRLGTVFHVSVGLSTLFVLWGVFFTENLARVASAILDYVIATFGWVYIIATFGFLLFVLYLAFSRHGGTRLGRDTDRPEFRTASWLAMMFSAGMGIGLMFFGVYEPVSHFSNPPFDLARPETAHAAQLAVQYSYFHWGLHAWGIFAVVGLALAYSVFRKGRRGLISPMFYPLLGERVEGPIGKAIDILAIFATLFGSATSLGLGALQIGGGLKSVFGLPNAIVLELAIIATMTFFFTLSAVTGVHRGIQYLSNINMILAAALLLFLLACGPTVFLLNFFTDSVGNYIGDFFQMSFRSAVFGNATWMQDWTIFYWAWWISWAPFVGTFIARISRGRTIREFVFGVLLVPSLVSFIWFSVFGGAAINLELAGKADISAETSQAAVLFDTLNAFPLSAVTSVLAIVLVALFFVSGADAASVVLGMLSSGGTLKPKTTVIIIWGTLTGLCAAVLLLAGGLNALQQAAILAAIPFAVVMIALCSALLRELQAERWVRLQPQSTAKGAAATTRSRTAGSRSRSWPDVR
jgi:glycine betaine transporter